MERPGGDRADTQLDAFCDHYNQQRPHRAIGRATPYARWAGAAPATAGESLPPPDELLRRRHCHVKVRPDGAASAGRWLIGLGAEYIGQPVEIVLDGLNADVFAGDYLIRHLRLDPPANTNPAGNDGAQNAKMEPEHQSPMSRDTPVTHVARHHTSPRWPAAVGRDLCAEFAVVTPPRRSSAYPNKRLQPTAPAPPVDICPPGTTRRRLLPRPPPPRQHPPRRTRGTPDARHEANALFDYRPGRTTIRWSAAQ